MSKISMTIETITPEKAKKYLAKNLKTNRPINPSSVKLFAELMKSKQFPLTHQGLAFDSTGKLIDGQNRLSAIIESVCTVTMMVTRGFPPKTFRAIDMGKSRSLHIAIGIHKRRAETWCAMMRLFPTQLMTTGNRISPMKVKAVDDRLSELHDKIFTQDPQGFSAVLRAAIVAASLMGYDTEENLREQFLHYIHGSVKLMTSKMERFWVGIKDGDINVVSNRREAFLKMLSVLDPDYQPTGTRRVQLSVSSERHDKAYAAIAPYFE